MPERQKSFEEVRRQVEYGYRQEKEMAASQELLKQMLKSKDVQIYTWKFESQKKESKEKEGSMGEALKEDTKVTP